MFYFKEPFSCNFKPITPKVVRACCAGVKMAPEFILRRNSSSNNSDFLLYGKNVKLFINSRLGAYIIRKTNLHLRISNFEVSSRHLHVKDNMKWKCSFCNFEVSPTKFIVPNFENSGDIFNVPEPIEYIFVSGWNLIGPNIRIVDTSVIFPCWKIGISSGL